MSKTESPEKAWDFTTTLQGSLQSDTTTYIGFRRENPSFGPFLSGVKTVSIL